LGLANNLMARVNHHLKDRHKGKWDRFSVYLTNDDEHIKPLESLMLRVINPQGNKVSGRLRGAQDMVRPLKRRMIEFQRDETASLLGGRFVIHRRRSKTKAAKGSLVLARLVGRPMRLIATYKGIEYKASLRRDGHISYKGNLYESPTGVAKVVVGRTVNGWHLWRYRAPRGEWVKLLELRR
jgi:Restriction Enzyme Adenine Methylase Associated